MPDNSFEMNSATEEDTLNSVAGQTVTEEVPMLDDFDEFQSSGAWPVGWYSGEVIEGYATQKGTQFQTSDDVSKKGDSRNALFCFRVQGPGGPRTMMHRINYLPEDFTRERLFEIKAKLKAGGPRDRHSLAVLNVSKLEKALGFAMRASNGQVVATRAIGHALDVHITIDKETGYNDINNFDKVGSHKAKPNGNKS